MLLFMGFIFMMPLGILTRRWYQAIPLIIAYIIKMYECFGMIKFTKQYWYLVITWEEFHNIVLSILLFFTFGGTIVVWIPQLLISAIFVSQWWEISFDTGNYWRSIFDTIAKPLVINKFYL